MYHIFIIALFILNNLNSWSDHVFWAILYLCWTVTYPHTFEKSGLQLTFPCHLVCKIVVIEDRYVSVPSQALWLP